MKVFDLYLGRVVAMPECVEAGRFRLMKPAVLNERLQLGQGEVLLSDGGERCAIGATLHTFVDHRYPALPSVDDSQDAQRSIVCRALELLATRAAEGNEALPSPLLPAEMVAVLELNKLDEALREIIDRGHLDEIVRRPRYSMKYESEVVDVSRVRRTAPGALERLAARSEDWHRRTITGVLPKRLLALLSDDDWGIYENKVFARLLDRLEHYLRLRLAETEGVCRVFEDALKLDKAAGLDFRLRERLCQLWGEATESSGNVTKSVIDESKYAIETLRLAKRKVGLLRHSDLYRKVPRSACVPAELRHTNILNHDQHYRHLKTLWHLHHKCIGPTTHTPEEVFRANQRELDQFCRYLQMMIRRVLRDIAQVVPAGTSADFSFAGSAGSLVAGKGEIALRVGGRELVFIPVLGSVPQVAPLRADGSGRLIVSRISTVDSRDFTGFESFAEGRFFSINPMDFYGEEKIRLLVERFLWSPVFTSYGVHVDRVPSEPLGWLAQHAIGRVERGSWRLLSPLTDRERALLEGWLPGAALNVDTRERISATVQRLAALGICRHGGSSASFAPRDDAFKANCSSCSTEWGIYSTAAGRMARMTTGDGACQDFSRFGSWCIEFGL